MYTRSCDRASRMSGSNTRYSLLLASQNSSFYRWLIDRNSSSFEEFPGPNLFSLCKKGMFLYSAVSSPLDHSKCFTLFAFPGRPVHSNTNSASLGSILAITREGLFTHISIIYIYNFWLPPYLTRAQPFPFIYIVQPLSEVLLSSSSFFLNYTLQVVFFIPIAVGHVFTTHMLYHCRACVHCAISLQGMCSLCYITVGHVFTMLYHCRACVHYAISL